MLFTNSRVSQEGNLETALLGLALAGGRMARHAPAEFRAKKNGVRKCLLMNQGCPSHSKIASASSFFEDRSILFRASSTDSIRLAAPARSFAGTSVGQDDVAPLTQGEE